MKHKFIIIIGPSGGGKTTLVERLKECGFVRLITCSTREPRKGEVDKKDYYFIKSVEEFMKMDKIEYTKYANNYYGTSVKGFYEQINNNDCYIIVDLKGAICFKQKYPDSKIIYVYNDLDVLEQRMRDRNDDEEKIKERIDNIIKEKELDGYKYADLVIKNDNIEESFNLLKKYIKTL